MLALGKGSDGLFILSLEGTRADDDLDADADEDAIVENEAAVVMARLIPHTILHDLGLQNCWVVSCVMYLLLLLAV